MDISKTAKLAKIRPSDKEAKRLLEKAKSVIKYVEQLNELNTDNIEPMSHAMDIQGALRDDIVVDYNVNKEIFDNAPELENGFFVVPKVIEE